MPEDEFNLAALARQEMIERGFAPDFSPEVERQLATIQAAPDRSLRDLTSLLWSSIDNDDSRDLDQIEWAERLADGRIRVLVGERDHGRLELAAVRVRGSAVVDQRTHAGDAKRHVDDAFASLVHREFNVRHQFQKQSRRSVGDGPGGQRRVRGGHRDQDAGGIHDLIAPRRGGGQERLSCVPINARQGVSPKSGCRGRAASR